MQKFKWGLIGAGNIAQEFVKAIDEIESSKIHSIASKDYKRARNFARKFEIYTIYDSYKDMIIANEIDAIYIATPHNLHFEISKMALEHGISVLCEKPICLNEEEFSKLTKIASRNYACLMEAMWTRFLPSIQELQRIIYEGSFGKVKFVNSSFEIDVPYDVNHRLYNKTLGGGALLDIGVYGITMADLILESFPENLNLSCNFAPTGVDKNIDVVLTYPNNQTARIKASLDCYSKHTCQIICEEAVIELLNFYNPEEIKITTSSQQEIVFNTKISGSPYKFQIIEFIRCVQSGELESPIHGWEQTAKILNIVDLINDMLNSQEKKTL